MSCIILTPHLTSFFINFEKHKIEESWLSGQNYKLCYCKVEMFLRQIFFINYSKGYIRTHIQMMYFIKMHSFYPTIIGL